LKKTTGYRPFKDLKSLYKGELVQKPPEKITPEEDLRLFHEAMADVKEIKEFRKIPFRRKPPKVIKSADCSEETMQTLRAIANGQLPLDISLTQEYVQWRLPCRTSATVEALHRGDYSVQDFIDLHGYTVAEARIVIEHFLKSSIKRGYRCVKVIHGRGLSSDKGPVLKKAVLRWLERDFRKWIVAYATAQPSDGGLGATYILLKDRL